MSTLYTERNNITRPTACGLCPTGIATGNNFYCHRCLDSIYGKSEGEIFSEEICDAARIRIARWYDADEVLRSSGGKRNTEHRFEGVIIRRLQGIIESTLHIQEKARLVIDVDVIAQDIEFEHSYNISARAIRKAHVEFGRALRAELPPKSRRRQGVSRRVGYLR